VNLIIERADVWEATVDDQPGGLARVLGSLKEVGADLDFIVARRSSEVPGKALVFIAPLRREEEAVAAAELGFNVTRSIQSLRVQGPNAPGRAAEITERLAGADLNLRGLSAAELGTRFVMYIGLDSEEDAEKAVNVLQTLAASSDSDWRQSAA
jgi:hypothetical protein